MVLAVRVSLVLSIGHLEDCVLYVGRCYGIFVRVSSFVTVVSFG